jgi:DNA-binding CsgD family transcriptional regulator/PAS domain-containing protein
MIDQKTFEESEVFNDWVKPGVGYDVFWGLGSKVGLWDRRSIAFAASHRSRSQGEMTERDRAAFRQLMPHLQRVLHLQSILKAHEARGLTLEAACDTAADGLFIVDAGGHVLYANRAALRLLAHGASLHLSREGRLQAGQPAEDAAMRRQIAAACSSEAPGERAAYLKFTGRNGLPLVATVSPVRAEQAGQRVRCCILAVQDIWKARSIDPVKIELALGLTKAEARLVGKLAEGMSMRDAAAGLGITYNTARTQLSSALQKTGLRRQNELMLAVSGLRHG